MSTATASEKPVIVLVHGIWHSPLTYSKLLSALRSSGYEVHVPYLPSCTGARPPTASLPEDTQLIRRLTEMLADQGRSILLLTHSYGGVVGCNAIEGLDVTSRKAQGKSGGVVQLIGIAAHLHPKGFSVFDIVREMGNEDSIPKAFNIADNGSFESVDAKASLFTGVPEQEANALMTTLSSANIDCMEAKVQFEGWRHVPLTYIRTTEDMTLPPHYQQRIVEKIEKSGTAVNVIEVQTGHSPFITMTQTLIEIIETSILKRQ